MRTLDFTSMSLLLLLAGWAGACSDDDPSPGTGGSGTGASGTGASTSSSTGAGAGATSSSSTASSGGSGGGEGGGGGGGGGAPFVPPTPFAIPLSAAGPDQLQSVAAVGDAAFVAAGFAASAVGGPRMVTVVKFSVDGALDSTFGDAGVATTELQFVGGSDEIDVIVQPDGKLLVSATVANATNASDRDIAVARMNADGSPDATFGTSGGVITVNLNDAHDNGTMLVGMDGARSITLDAAGEIFVHAVSRALGLASGGGPRIDTDFTVLKLTPAGVVDDAFGDAGQARVDIQEANATPRRIQALGDGTLLASGYANTPDLMSTQPVLYKLTSAGELDDTFATGGIYHQAILATQAEIYGFAVHGANLVTAGYGRNTGDTNDYLSLRFDVASGERDLTWGGEPNGAVMVDPSGTKLGSNARGAVGLPGGETVIIGSTGPSNTPEQNAVFVILDENGELDTDYGTGIHVLPLGNDGNDQFWGGAAGGTHVALVGHQGGGMTQTDTVNDDAYAVVFEIQP